MRHVKNLFYLSGFMALLLFTLHEGTKLVRAGVSCSVPNIFSNGTTADATQVNANFSALVACFTNAASSGANSDITSLTGLTTPLSAGQGGTQYFWGGSATGSANVQVVTTVRPSTGFSLVAGVRVCFTPAATNTGATTVNVNGTGATALGRYIQTSTGVTVGTLVGGELNTLNPSVCMVGAGGQYILESAVYFPGEVKDFAFAGCPTGWQEPTGGNVSAANFPDINTALGTTWGVSGGNTVMPDLRGRATFSRDGTGTRLTTDQSGALAGNTVGTTGGLQNQTLTNAQLPSITPTFTATNSYSPSFVGNAPGSVALNSNVPIMSGGSFSASTEFTISASGSTAPSSSGVGRGWTNTAPNTTIPTPTGSLSPASYTPTGTVSSFGSGSSHPVTPPLGIVTKCVKL